MNTQHLNLLFAFAFNTSTSASVWTPTEIEVFNLVNQQRSLHNLGTLQADDRLHQSAALHSTDMGTNNYFSHTGSNGSNAGERILAAGYNWNQLGGAWGENIAAGYGQGLDALNAARDVMYGTTSLTTISQFSVDNGKGVFTSWNQVGTDWDNALWDKWYGEIGGGWMGSSAHRGNILSKFFADIGIGLYIDENDGLLIDGTGPYYTYWTQNFAAGDTAVVPLPSAIIMFAGGLTILGFNRHKHRI